MGADGRDVGHRLGPPDTDSRNHPLGRLSPRTARDEHVRHDFPVDEYESERAAREAATDFLEFFTK